MSDLIVEGQKQNLIRLEDGGKYIFYLHQQKRRNYENPEERIQANAFLTLVLVYKYPIRRIRQFILDGYYGFVTGEIEKKIETGELRTQLYPRNAGPFMNLSLSYLQIGQFEKAVPEASEALRLAPKSTIPYGQLGHAFTGLNRFGEAREILERGLRQSPDVAAFHLRLYQLSFVSGDTTAMQQQLDWAKGKPDEYVTLDWQTGAASFAGERRRAEGLSRRSIDDALRSDAKQVAAEYLAEAALRGAVFDQCTRSKAAAMQALALKSHLSRLTSL